MTNAVNIAQSGSNNQTFRNRIINGAMTIDQRNAGASVTPTDSFTLDRWQAERSQASKFSVQQNAGSVTPPPGFNNYLGVTSLSAYSVISTDYFVIRQLFEGFNTADLGFGTANAQPVTLSFWVRSSLTGTFGGSLKNDGNTRSYPFSYTISSANTWEYKTITIPGDTTGTWPGATNGRSMTLSFSLGAGASNAGTAGSWQSGNLISTTGATSVVGTNGATWYVTGVQFEEGTAASPFENRLYGTELNLCQRYYETLRAAFSFDMQIVNGSYQNIIVGTWDFQVEKRATPTVASFPGLSLTNLIDRYGIGNITPNNINFDGVTSQRCKVWCTLGSTFSLGEQMNFANISGNIGFANAEL